MEDLTEINEEDLKQCMSLDFASQHAIQGVQNGNGIKV
jgi:hypothetical protein